MQRALLSICVLAASCSAASATLATNFLRSGLVAESDVQEFLTDELLATGESAGSRAHDDVQHVRYDEIQHIRRDLRAMFSSLPKNGAGKLSHQVVRYALHRFFVRRHGWFIRGLEPNNDTWHGAADPDSHNSSAMREWVPSYLQDVLEKQLGHDGADLNQLAALAAALQDLARKETKGRVETAFGMYEHSTTQMLSRKEVDSVILTYFVAVLNSGDFEARTEMEAMWNTQDFIRDYTGWNVAHEWLQELMSKHLRSKGNEEFDFQGVEHLANKIQEDYYTLNEKDCEDLKVTLRGMQGNKPGRVRLSTFYNKGMYSHWDFSEKKEYLSSLGVLDETDADHPFVVIANYAMSRPNCLDSSNLYTICCKNECEELMGKLESSVQGASADPGVLVKLVAGMPSATVASPRQIPPNLVKRLDDIAAQHDGLVPLHGRLFAQWMHHTYPLECPFPHETGTINPLTRDEWMKETGSASEKASTEEMMEHIASDSCAIGPDGAVKCADETAELPWNDNEELLTWYKVAPKIAPSQPRRRVGAGTALLACSLAVIGLFIAVKKRGQHVVSRPLVLLAFGVVACYAVGLLDGTLLVFVLVVGSFVTIANKVTTRAHPKGVTESKDCV